MIDNRIALSAVAAARLFAVIALTFCAVSFGTGQSYAQTCPPNCGPGNNDPGIPDPNATPDDPNTPSADPNAVPDNGNSSDNGGQTTQPTLPEPQAPAPTVVPPAAAAPVTVTSSVGEPFVITTTSPALVVVVSGRNDLISPVADIEAMLPDGMKSSAQNAYLLLGTGSIDLLQIEAAANAYKAFSYLNSVEQQALFEFMFYGPTSLQDGYLALMKILPSDDPFHAKALEYGRASIASSQAAGSRIWALKRAVNEGYATKIAWLSGLSSYTLRELCIQAFEGDSTGEDKCRDAVE